MQNNKNIEYQYDLLGRLTDILYSDSTQNVTMTYDAGTGVNLVGRLASVTDPSGMVEYSYDDNGNVETVTRTINSAVFVTSYEYDNAGNLRTVIYPSGHTIDYQPDATYPALISGVVLDGSQQLAANITYSPFGPSKTMTLGNGIQTTKTYDKNYQVLTLSAGTTMDRTYIPDAVGNIEVITDNLDNNRTQSFGYDDFYRLTHATGIYGSIDFTYDLVGNRLSRNQTGPSSSNDTYNYYPDTNRLQTVVGDHAELIEYDADGNITARIPGASNRTPPVTGSSDYTYSSSGQRSQKAGATAVIYHYDLFGQLIAETDHQGNLIKAYVWLLGKPLAQIAANGSVYYYHNDHLGTPQKMTDGNGNVVWAADYLPFGKADVTIGIVENNLRLPGQYYDSETGLHYNWHRYYDPTIGRYLRADPLNFSSIINNDITFQKIYEITTNNKLPVYFYKSQLLDEIFTNPTALNPYIYANDNPIINIDSIGLQSKNVLNWIKKLKACKDCEEAISNPDGDEWDAFVRCKKCCKGLQRRSYFSVTPCEQACVEIWKEKHNKN